jgi:hypothetical protein
MALLIFGAVAATEPRIVLGVTILQQDVAAPLKFQCSNRRINADENAIRNRISIWTQPAKELGKRWRFFATYAQV